MQDFFLVVRLATGYQNGLCRTGIQFDELSNKSSTTSYCRCTKGFSGISYNHARVSPGIIAESQSKSW